MELGDEHGASGLKKRHEAMIILIGSVAGVVGLILALENKNSGGSAATSALPSASSGTSGTSAVATDYSSQLTALQQEITGVAGGLSQDQTALQAVQSNQGALAQGITQLGAAFNTIAQQLAADEAAATASNATLTGQIGNAYNTLVAQIAQNKADAASAIGGVSAQDQQGLAALQAAFQQALTGVEGDVSKLSATDQASIAALAQQQASSLASLTDTINSKLSTQQQQIAAQAAGFTSVTDWINALHTVSIQNSNVLTFDPSGNVPGWNHGFTGTPAGAPTVTPL